MDKNNDMKLVHGACLCVLLLAMVGLGTCVVIFAKLLLMLL